MRNEVALFGAFLCIFCSNWGFGERYYPGNLTFTHLCLAVPHWIEAEVSIEESDGSTVVLPYLEVDPNPGQTHFCALENRYSVGRLLHEHFCGLDYEPAYKITFRLRTCTETEKSDWSPPLSIDRDRYYQDWLQASYMFGDFNNDLRVDLADAIKLLKFFSDDSTDIIAYYYADLNEDNKVDIGDAITLLSHIFGEDNVPMLETLIK